MGCDHNKDTYLIQNGRDWSLSATHNYSQKYSPLAEAEVSQEDQFGVEVQEKGLGIA